MSDSATTAWKNAVVAAGGTVSGGREADVDALIVGLKADGIWTKLDRLWLLAAENSQSALIDLKGLIQAAPGASPTFTPNRGYTCIGAGGYVNMLFIPSTHGVNYTLNDAHFAIWNLTDGQSTASAAAFNTSASSIYPRYTDDNAYLRVNSNSGGGYPNADARGWLVAQRTGSFTIQGYKNGISMGADGSVGVSGLDTDVLVLFAREHAAVSLGGSLNSTEQLAFYNRLHTYMAAVGLFPPEASASLVATGSLQANSTVKGTSLSAILSAAGRLQASSQVTGTSLSARLAAAGGLQASATAGAGGLVAGGAGYVALQRGMFIHWNMATFIGTDLIDPTYPPNTFAPTGLNIPQWIDTAKKLGATYAVLTIKHLDGFCLWPTTTTTQGIANTTWYSTHGNPDVTQIFVDECRAQGILPGFYFNIADGNWIANHPGFTTAQFKAFNETQITEVLTRYGPVVCIWFDSTEWYLGGPTPWATVAERANFVHGAQPGIIFVNNGHIADLADLSDIVEYESTVVTGSASFPNEACFTPVTWFWESDTAVPTDIGTMGSRIHQVNSNNGTILINLPPNTAGVIPQSLVDWTVNLRKYLGETPRVSPTNMTSDTAPSPYVASASTEYSGFEAYNCFNLSDGDWSSNAVSLPQWIQIDLGSNRTVNQYMMQTRGVLNHQWLAWNLAGSNNGSTWTTVDSRDRGSTYVADGQADFFDLAAPANYRYWRWTITNSVSGTNADSASLALFGPEIIAVQGQGILAGAGALSVATKQVAQTRATLAAAGALSVATRQVAQTRATLAATATFGTSLVAPPIGATISASGVLAAYASTLSAASMPPVVQSIEERLHPEYDVHLVTHWNCQLELLASSGTLVGRASPGRGDAESIIIDAPLKLDDGKLTIDIEALKDLLGLP